jgi:hypothetical protein
MGYFILVRLFVRVLVFVCPYKTPFIPIKFISPSYLPIIALIQVSRLRYCCYYSPSVEYSDVIKAGKFETININLGFSERL